MTGYEYLLARNRLLFELEDEIAKRRTLPPEQQSAEIKRLRAAFDVRLAELYKQVSDLYPGERHQHPGSENKPH